MGLSDLWQTIMGRAAESGGDADLSDLNDRLLEQLGAAGLTLDQFQEAIAELELRLMDADDRDWVPLSDGGEFDFSREFLDRIIHSARLHGIKNPLIKRAVQVYAVYVWGQGVTVTATGRVNDVVQAFLTDPGNRASVFGHKARTRLQRTLTTDGSVPLRFFPNRSTGRVKVRYLSVDQIRAVVKNPEDPDEVWFYLRQWTSEAGVLENRLYPHIGYNPDPVTKRQHRMAGSYKGVRIDFETPMYLHKVGDLAGMDFGVPEVYASIDWAKAVKEYLSDWKKFVRSLNRWAFQMKTKGDQTAVDAVQRKLDTQFSATTGGDANPAPVAGSVAVAGDGVDLQPLRVGGAAVKADDVRQLLLEMAAGVGLPETFFGDADAGSLATAKSLDRPTELIFRDYQSGWTESYEDIFAYVIDQAAISPKGTLHDLLDHIDDDTGAAVLKEEDPQADGEAVSRAVDVDWPPVVHDDVKETVTAIALAVKTGAIDDAPLVARMLLTALGEQDIDAALKRLYPPDDEEPEAIPLAKAPAPGVPAPAPPTDEPATERLAAALEQLRLTLP